MLFVCNVDEASAGTGNELSRRVEAMAAGLGARTVTVAAGIEAEIAGLEDAERAEYLRAWASTSPA